MTPVKNDRYLRAIAKQPIDRTPVWMMRQAGRYLPEYRAVRQKAKSFMGVCTQPELACEVTLQPLRRYPLDAAILFSDILTIPDAMGLGLYFSPDEGPKFEHPLRTAQAIQNLPIPDPEDSLGYVMQAVKLIQQELAGSTPLIGFSGSPWTLATYMVEGGSSKTFGIIKTLLYQNSSLLHTLLDKLADSVSLYLKAQARAGADALMIFDTWGGVLTPQAYADYSLFYMNKIVQDLKSDPSIQVPITLFTKNGGAWIEHIAATGCDMVGLDWTINIGEAKARIGQKVALQGNLDPSILLAEPRIIEQEVQRILRDFGTGSGHVFNLGHGITPNVPPEHVTAFIESVQRFSQPFHQEAQPQAQSV